MKAHRYTHSDLSGFTWLKVEPPDRRCVGKRRGREIYIDATIEGAERLVCLVRPVSTAIRVEMEDNGDRMGDRYAHLARMPACVAGYLKGCAKYPSVVDGDKRAIRVDRIRAHLQP